jgi:D-alanyl-D-alanine-carboxypeptidase/D-alanyl-D-alanine-endopeptidase
MSALFRRAVISALILASARAGLAAQTADWKPKIDALAQPLVDSETVVGLAVGIVDAGKTAVFGYGRASRSADKPPDGQTLFEIGSITKVFTGLALADMAREKLVSLDDPVGKLLPDTVKVPQRDNRTITLLDLATHTSGLPRLPQNLLPLVAKHPENPYAQYTVEQMYEAISSGSLATTPGEKFAYSNYGMGLLGHALARRAGMSYEELIRQRICAPLGMKETQIRLSDPQKLRFAEAHDADGTRIQAWDIPTLAGCGALRSTVNDLVLFVSANLGLRPSRLSAAIEASHQPRREIAKGTESIALGWHLRTKEGVCWHNGQTGGYHSFVGFQKQRKIGVVVLGNTAGGTVDQLGFRLLKLLAGEPVEPIKLRMPVRLDPAVLDPYVGNYELYPNFILTVSLDGGRLMVQATGQPRLRVFPESDTQFFYRAVDARITFVQDKDGKVNKLILHQHGLDMPAWKNGIAVQLGKTLIKAITSGPDKPGTKDGSKDKGQPK